MSKAETLRPCFSNEEIKRFALKLYSINASARQLASYSDQNFYLKDENGKEYVFKIANSDEKIEVLDAQNKAMEYLKTHINNFAFPHVLSTTSGEQISSVKSKDGKSYLVRMLTYLDGELLAELAEHNQEVFHRFGQFIGTIDNAIMDFYHSAAYRYLPWDLKNASWANQKLCYIENPRQRTLVEYFLFQFETLVMPFLPQLRTSVIHNDANDHNILVRESQENNRVMFGIIDFGDIVYTHTVCELAIAVAYIMMGKNDPLAVAKQVIQGYHEKFPLTEFELYVLFYLICARLCISVTMSAYQKKLEPENEYIIISEKLAWELLEKVIEFSPERATKEFRQVCGFTADPQWQGRNKQEILNLRDQHIGKSLSVSYQKPLKIVRGAMQYLYDEEDRTYLDAVNNVPHVGHCHPKVVKAAQRQMAILNTNTRYLHDSLVEYAQRLTSKMPDPLSVCFFVCSGSEANDLALRMARTHTGQKDIIVVDGAYHGNTTANIEISPYKFDGPGGRGAEPYIHKVPMPDIYRGLYRADDPDAAKKYANHIQEKIEQLQSNQKNIAAFICESLLGCGGQIVLPENYLKEAFQHVRKAGGICIADEVQIGFGRVGTHFWGFETQNVVPDIVTLGKPIGNGHPLAAVVTTPEIADSFNNGMEYFNTYGGNPVSCAVGLAVLDVIEEEKLQENALIVGTRLKNGLKKLMEKYPLIGDVRGMGLFIGVELVLDRETLEPATKQASYIIERMKEEGILISTDGPLHNVLKIKPPLVFTEDNADSLVRTLDIILKEDRLYQLMNRIVNG
jgi:4-aminobutyrate aminotransferase-like enzyme/Ser/Thr protein kinase RdoA (MazF antagonist)